MWWIVFAVAYFLCPLDGDFLFPVGWIDDVVVAWYCWQQYQNGRVQQPPTGTTSVQTPLIIDGRR